MMFDAKDVVKIISAVKKAKISYLKIGDLEIKSDNIPGLKANEFPPAYVSPEPAKLEPESNIDSSEDEELLQLAVTDPVAWEERALDGNSRKEEKAQS